MSRKFQIKDLSATSLTRKRGHEAYLSLKPYLGEEQVEIDLRSVDLISMSFLDGFIVNLLDSGTAEQVTFLVSETKTLNKLSRIVTIRNAELYFSEFEGSRALVPGLPLSSNEELELS